MLFVRELGWKLMRGSSCLVALKDWQALLRPSGCLLRQSLALGGVITATPAILFPLENPVSLSLELSAGRVFPDPVKASVEEGVAGWR